jgi:hypothetical protein
MARVRRFIPLAFVCYVVAYLDRQRGVGATDLQRDLGLSATAHVRGAPSTSSGRSPTRASISDCSQRVVNVH